MTAPNRGKNAHFGYNFENGVKNCTQKIVTLYPLIFNELSFKKCSVTKLQKFSTFWYTHFSTFWG